jgi:hypothetical protein
MKIFFMLIFSLSVLAIDSTVIHPIFEKEFACSDHYEGKFKDYGDARGKVCFIHEFKETDGRSWFHAYRGSGKENEDWYGWKQKVISPVTGMILKRAMNPKTNTPGIKSRDQSTYLIIRSDSGVHIFIAGIRDIVVRDGQRVKAGDFIGRVGNNGRSYFPSIHIGAWLEKVPLQLSFDLKELAILRESI